MKSASTSSRCIFNLLPALVAAMGGCAMTGSYPADWPAEEDKLVGKCPEIAGTYSNIGVRHPTAAMPLTLTQILGLEDGERVVIDQSPDTISVAAWKSGQPRTTVVFRSGEVSVYGLTGWDANRPGTFNCPIDALGFERRLSFSHLSRSSVGGAGGFGAGVVVASGESVHFTKGTDGSLLLHFSEGWGALIGPVPVGATEQFWIRFPPAGK